MNGNGVIHANGKPNGKANGHSLIGRKRSATQGRSFLAWAFGVVARLTAWAAILSVIFRCPSSLEECDETSPRVCIPYFRVKNTLTPHVQPYYDQYAAPYVEVARPYYNLVDNKVWEPTRTYAVQYGGPWVNKARDQALTQWEKNGQPQLTKYQTLAKGHYDQSVAPYVNQAGEMMGPYYEIARTNGLQLYYDYLVPSYDFVSPYAAQGYDAASYFTTTTALPTAYWAWSKTHTFLDHSVWPHVRVLYVQNVEPQLVRIGERLGRHKTPVKPVQEVPSSSSVTDSIASSFEKPKVHSSTIIESSSEIPIATESPVPQTPSEEYINPVQAPPAAENESEKRKKAREMVAQDLETWQTKFATQADEGATDIEERVAEVAKRMIEDNAKVTGKHLYKDLETTVDSALENLRAQIIKLAETSENNPDRAHEQVITAIRSSGAGIKKKAQAIRQWREEYDNELQDTVIAVADIHFQILDETRNLALQQIGMRWAWTDGVTYKDWAKYHELKRTLNDWTEQLKQLVVTHPGLQEAQDASAQIEDEGIELASSTAKELARLKDVARWKLEAQDVTDSFDSTAMKLAAQEAIAAREAKSATKSVASGVSETVNEATAAAHNAEQQIEDFAAPIVEPAKEELSSVFAASEVSESAKAVLEDESSHSVNIIEGATSAIVNTVESVASDASSLVFEGEESAASIVDQVSESAEAQSSVASESVVDAAEVVSSELSEVISSATDASVASDEDEISNGSDEPYPAVEEPLVEIEEDLLTQRDETPLSDEPLVKPAFIPGAAAQEVPHRQVVLDDYVDTDIIASATSAAQEVYSNALGRASEQYSSALSVVSAQIYGTPKPVHEKLLASVSDAYDRAVSVANEKYSGATEAASTAAQQLPATTTVPNWVDWERIESVASQKLNEGKLWADIQYQSALLALGLATPTPSSNMDKYYEQAKFNYFAGLGLAQDRYSSFLAGASSALSSLTATPTPTDLAGSASSIASVARESASSVAQAAGDAAGSAVSAASESVMSAAQVVDDSVSSVLDAANEQISNAGLAIADSWDVAVAQISGQVYGEQSQIGWYEQIWGDATSYAAQATDAAADSASTASGAAAASAAAASAEALKQYESVSGLVSELINGKEPSFTESVLSRLQAAYATAAAKAESYVSQASEAASSVGDKAGSAASEASEAVKKSAQNVRDEL